MRKICLLFVRNGVTNDLALHLNCFGLKRSTSIFFHVYAISPVKAHQSNSIDLYLMRFAGGGDEGGPWAM